MVQCGCLRTTLLAVILNMSSVLTVPADLVSAPERCHINSLCQCRANQFSCFSVPLHKLPEWPTLSIQRMDVTGATIRELEEGSLDGLRLSSFTFVANKLNQIAPNTFGSSASTLLTLDIGFNELTEVPYEALHNLEALFWINLQNNDIATVSGDWSRLAGSLLSISLSNNAITHLSSPSFRKLLHLTRLDVDGNKLRSLSSSHLPQSLVELQASRNLIETFSCSTLLSLPNLKTLILKDNILRYMPRCPSNHSISLEKLDISDNFILSIDDDLHNSSLSVKELDLGFNLLTNLQSASFRNTKSSKIVLSQNQIKNIAFDAFVGLEKTLQTLELDNNNLRILPNSLFLMHALKHLSLASNRLLNLPRLPENIETLILSSNLFNEVPTKVLQESKLNQLKLLDLSYNHINHLHKRHFDSWGKKLITLILKGNIITRLDANVFSNLNILRKLSLSFNEIYHIQDNGLSNMSTKLTVLEMSSSMYVEEFPIDIYNSFSSIVWLSLDNNNYRSIKKYALHYFQNLQYLNLGSNQLPYVPKNILDSRIHGKLRDLRLSDNILEHIDSNTFAFLSELKSIDISSNKIKNISSQAFLDLDKVAFISLANNIIEAIDDAAFTNLKSLMVLELQYNKLEDFSLNSFKNVSNSMTTFVLNISYNRITKLIASEEAFIEILDCSHNDLSASLELFLIYIAKSLRKLFLSFNRIHSLGSESFGNLSKLEVLKINNNQIKNIHRRTFSSLSSIQILDLSNNAIEHFSVEQFSNLRFLRHISIGGNNITSLPRRVFRNTILEYLDLRKNNFIFFPNSALSQIGFTLRYLDLSYNSIQYLDGTLFQETPFLLELFLAHNKISELSDNTFVSIPRVRVLDLSWNNVKANFKEVLQHMHNLNKLNFAGMSLYTLPYLTLGNLTALDVSSNFITDIKHELMKNLTNLRILNLSNNRFKKIPTQIWHHLKYVNILDISDNPIKSITSDSFIGLHRLKDLKIDNLYDLSRFDQTSLSPLRSLSTLSIEFLKTSNQNSKSQMNYGKIISHAPSLHKISIVIFDDSLEKQLYGVFNKKLKVVEITGKNLKTIHPTAFEGSEDNKELTLSIKNTNISELPLGFFDHLGRISYLSLDLSNNQLTSLSPAILYPNTTSWNRVATKLIAGGLLLNNNPLECHCELAWIGGWLRRWLRESIEVGGAPVPVSRAIHDAVRVATCRNPLTGETVPLVHLRPDHTDCFASALASAATAALHTTILFKIIICYLFIVTSQLRQNY